MDKVNIGKLRHRVELQKRQKARDNYGGNAGFWTTQRTVWAMIEPLKGWERYHAQQIESRVSHKITIRHQHFSPPIDAQDEWRVRYGLRPFRIQAAINVDERKEYMQLHCQELKRDRE